MSLVLQGVIYFHLWSFVIYEFSVIQCVGLASVLDWLVSLVLQEVTYRQSCSIVILMFQVLEAFASWLRLRHGYAISFAIAFLSRLYIHCEFIGLRIKHFLCYY